MSVSTETQKATRCGARSFRRTLIRLAFFALVSSSCYFSEQDTDQVATTPARFIDSVCASGAYELEGDARLTTGLTGESCGFALGPKRGEIRFRFDSAPNYGETSVRALVADADENSITNPGWVNLDTTFEPELSATLSSNGRRRYIVDLAVRRTTPIPGGCN